MSTLRILSICLFLLAHSACTAPQTIPDFPKDIEGRLKPAVVDVRSFEVLGCGGAFVGRYTILTAAHCVFSGHRIQIALFDDQKNFFDAELVYHDPKADLALLRVEGALGQAPLPIQLRPLERDEAVATMGHPGRLFTFEFSEIRPRDMYKMTVGHVEFADENNNYAKIQISLRRGPKCSCGHRPFETNLSGMICKSCRTR